MAKKAISGSYKMERTRTVTDRLPVTMAGASDETSCVDPASLERGYDVLTDLVNGGVLSMPMPGKVNSPYPTDNGGFILRQDYYSRL